MNCIIKKVNLSEDWEEGGTNIAGKRRIEVTSKVDVEDKVKVFLNSVF